MYETLNFKTMALQIGVRLVEEPVDFDPNAQVGVVCMVCQRPLKLRLRTIKSHFDKGVQFTHNNPDVDVVVRFDHWLLEDVPAFKAWMEGQGIVEVGHDAVNYPHQSMRLEGA